MTGYNYRSSALDERTLAYVAGLFDGEGTIAMGRTAPGGLNLKCSTVVVNTDRAVLDWLQGLFGGNVYGHDPKIKPDNWRHCYQWHLNGRESADFTAAIAPFLRIKAALAANALEFFSRKRRRVGRSTPPDLAAQLEELYARHQLLSTRGRDDAVEVVPELEASPQLELLA